MAPRDGAGRDRRGAGHRALKPDAPGPDGIDPDDPVPEEPALAGSSRRRVALLGTLFAAVVVAIVVHGHTLFVPLTLGLLAWSKQLVVGWAKLLTPKLALVVVKNGAVIKARDVVVGSATRFLVLSHRPWRRGLLAVRLALAGASARAGRALLARWLVLPLWLRCLVAALLLAATASSAWAVLALLIVPQPIVEFLKARTTAFLNKLGVLRGLDALWHRTVPAAPRRRIDRWRRWTLGRRQVRASREVRARVAAAAAAAAAATTIRPVAGPVAGPLRRPLRTLRARWIKRRTRALRARAGPPAPPAPTPRARARGPTDDPSAPPAPGAPPR